MFLNERALNIAGIVNHSDFETLGRIIPGWSVPTLDGIRAVDNQSSYWTTWSMPPSDLYSSDLTYPIITSTPPSPPGSGHIGQGGFFLRLKIQGIENPSNNVQGHTLSCHRLKEASMRTGRGSCQLWEGMLFSFTYSLTILLFNIIPCLLWREYRVALQISKLLHVFSVILALIDRLEMEFWIE